MGAVPPAQRTRTVSLAAVIAGFVLLYFLMDRSAAWLGSFRGEYGLLVAANVLAAALAIELALTRVKPSAALRALGLGPAHGGTLLWTALLCAALLLFYPIHAAATGTAMRLHADWLILLPGLFAQGGIAEETVFRGFLFRHIRARHSFWRAAWIAALPFVAVHLVLFATMEWPVALASVLMSLSLAFPMSFLFERGGFSIWPPALLHFTVQGSIKLVETPDLAGMAVAWIALGATAPWLVFFLRPVQPAR